MAMRFITVTELKQRATQVISEIESSKEEVVITKNGKPVALIQAISENAFSLKQKEEVKGHGRVRESRGKGAKENKA
jgi:prevent-host-death family protein